MRKRKLKRVNHRQESSNQMKEALFVIKSQSKPAMKKKMVK